MENKNKFIFKFVLFLVFSVFAPITYLVIRFNLFTSKQSLSFWAVLVICLLLGIVVFIIKYYLDGMKTKYSFFKQVLTGCVKVIFPIMVVLGFAVFFKIKAEYVLQNINHLIETLSIILVCEVVGIIINPLPKWAFDNNVDGLADITDRITKKESE